jgi:serine/threonine protein kinase/WD40 repeat protein
MSANIQTIEVLFHRALEFRPEERAAFLAGACGRDTVLLARVHSLLEAHQADQRLLPEEPRQGLPYTSPAERPGDRIAQYKLLEQIGEGGCGVVYMAEQLEPVRRRVALKIIKLGMDTQRVVARFEAERQALALMDHPNIAKVFDAGATPTGRPFFVMELVRGVPINEYCARNVVSTAQRLQLIIQVCRAIQHAHQKGIIHRDLKPSNVLVTLHDGVPVPMVIDFGIAKAIEGKLTEHTLFTAFEQFMGTPAYMSPEQAQLKGLDVDTRTDIYSLGVLLYELLTGTTPFDGKELLAAGLDEMRRTIREKEPARPSTRLTHLLTRGEPARSPATASAPEKQVGPGDSSPDWIREQKALIEVLRGDLDWVVMKCLEKDRRRRYETANGLAMDLERHLKNEPVVARPPTNLYRLRKLVRRNKFTFAAGTAVLIALVCGILGSTWEAIRARRAERAQAALRAEADRAGAGEARQRHAAEQHLYQALLDEARSRQLSGSAGQRFESLAAITRAAAIRPSLDLSDAAVAALALPDLRQAKSWRLPKHWMAENLCFDDTFNIYAYRTDSGISVCRVADNQEICAVPIKDVPDMVNGFLLRRFDPQSRYLVGSCITTQEQVRCRVWDLQHQGALVLDLPALGSPDFSPDGRQLALRVPGDAICLQDLSSGRELGRIRVNEDVDMLRFSPDGLKLAGLRRGASVVHVWEVASGTPLMTLRLARPLSCFAWSPKGNLMALGYESGAIDICNIQSGELKTRLEGHETHVSSLAFSHQGDLLASASWDRTLRLWDVVRGKQAVVMRSHELDLHFSADDHLLAYAISGETCALLEVATPTGLRRLPGGVADGKFWNADFSPDARLLAVSTSAGVEFWDVASGQEIGLLQTADCRTVLFATNATLSILGTTLEGVFQWPLEIESTAGGSFLRVNPPHRLLPPGEFRYLALDRSKSKLMASLDDLSDPFVIELNNPTNYLRLQGHPRAQFVALAPDGRLAATGAWKGTGVSIYELDTGRLIHRLPTEGTSLVVFSPDAQWLATAEPNAFKLWRTASWEPAPDFIPGDGVSEINPLAFSSDSSLLALVRAVNEVHLVKVPGCQPVTTLRAPSLGGVSAVRFSPNGGQLAVVEWSGQVDLWDLRAVRAELDKLKLDWALPPWAPRPSSVPTIPERLRLDAGPISRQDLARAIPARAPNTPARLIDLTPFYNAPLTQSWHSRKEAGNDLRALPQGMQQLAGVDFDIRGLIQIGAAAANGLRYPNHVQGISIGQACRKLHFLHAAIFSGAAQPGDSLGSYVFHYVDGTVAELPILEGKDMADWWSQPPGHDGSATVVWTGSNPSAQAAGRTIRLFKTTWENPTPLVPLRSVDFTSDKPTPGQPFLVAITAEP